MGDILVHCSGRGIKGCDGVVVLKGYHRIMYESEKNKRASSPFILCFLCMPWVKNPWLF